MSNLPVDQGGLEILILLKKLLQMDNNFRDLQKFLSARLEKISADLSDMIRNEVADVVKNELKIIYNEGSNGHLRLNSLRLGSRINVEEISGKVYDMMTDIFLEDKCRSTCSELMVLRYTVKIIIPSDSKTL